MNNGLGSWNSGSTGNGQTMSHRPMLGQLLVGAGVVPETTMQECLARAKNDCSRIGEALVIGGHIDAQCLQSTILVQDLVSSGAMTQKTALKLIASTTRNRIPLAQLTEVPKGESKVTSLATLLVEADLVNREVIVQAKTQSSSSRRGITQTLQSISSLSNRDLDSAFHALSMVCDSEISKEQATEALKTAHQQNRRIQEFLPESHYQLAKHSNTYAELAISQELPACQPAPVDHASAIVSLKDFLAGPNLAFLLGTLLLVVGSCIGNCFVVPESYRGIGFCVIAAAAAALIMVIGLTSRHRLQKNESDMRAHLSNAQEMKSRLTKRRNTSC